MIVFLLFSQNNRLIENIQIATFSLVERQQNVFYWWTPIYERTKSGLRFKEARQSIFRQADNVR